ncbi:MAG: hypothetical protein AAB458_02580 [Patescibacteria group bacterium]
MTYESRIKNQESRICVLFLACFLFLASCFVFARSAIAQNTATVDLVWEANSYVPPFYKGKALTTTDGDVDVYAFVPSTFGNPLRATYTWELNSQVLGSLSGVGRSSLRVSGSPFIDDRAIRVRVVGENGREGFGYVRIPAVKPTIMVYVDSPLAGVQFGNAVVTRLEAQTETDLTLTAYPYFFSTSDRNENLSYTWNVNGVASETRGPTLVARSETTGTSTVSVEINNVSKILERASKIFSVVLQ